VSPPAPQRGNEPRRPEPEAKPRRSQGAADPRPGSAPLPCELLTKPSAKPDREATRFLLLNPLHKRKWQLQPRRRCPVPRSGEGETFREVTTARAEAGANPRSSLSEGAERLPSARRARGCGCTRRGPAAGGTPTQPAGSHRPLALHPPRDPLAPRLAASASKSLHMEAGGAVRPRPGVSGHGGITRGRRQLELLAAAGVGAQRWLFASLPLLLCAIASLTKPSPAHPPSRASRPSNTITAPALRSPNPSMRLGNAGREPSSSSFHPGQGRGQRVLGDIGSFPTPAWGRIQRLPPAPGPNQEGTQWAICPQRFCAQTSPLAGEALHKPALLQMLPGFAIATSQQDATLGRSENRSVKKQLSILTGAEKAARTHLPRHEPPTGYGGELPILGEPRAAGSSVQGIRPGQRESDEPGVALAKGRTLSQDLKARSSEKAPDRSLRGSRLCCGAGKS